MDIIDSVKEYVLQKSKEYKKYSEDHYDFWCEHIKLVFEESVKLADKYGADKEIVSLGALLHDIALIERVGDKKEHHINGEQIARKVLNKLQYDEIKEERVLKCIYNHRSSKNAQTIEEICVADADILAHFDNIPMLFNSLLVIRKVPLSDIREEMKKTFEKDFGDLSERTQKIFKARYDLIIDIVLK